MTNRVRPAGVSPGTLAFVAAWLVGAAIARLTGSAAVLLLLAASLVALFAAVISSWLAVRRCDIETFEVPALTTVGQRTVASLVHRGIPASGALVSVFDARSPRAASIGALRLGTSGALRPTGIDLTFANAGVTGMIRVVISTAGPAGLFWWKRTTDLMIDPVNIAPQAVGPVLAIVQTPIQEDGPSAAESGHRNGDIDGVRPWREGTPTTGFIGRPLCARPHLSFTIARHRQKRTGLSTSRR